MTTIESRGYSSSVFAVLDLAVRPGKGLAAVVSDVESVFKFFAPWLRRNAAGWLRRREVTVQVLTTGAGVAAFDGFNVHLNLLAFSRNSEIDTADLATVWASAADRAGFTASAASQRVQQVPIHDVPAILSYSIRSPVHRPTGALRDIPSTGGLCEADVLRLAAKVDPATGQRVGRWGALYAEIEDNRGRVALGGDLRSQQAPRGRASALKPERPRRRRGRPCTVCSAGAFATQVALMVRHGDQQRPLALATWARRLGVDHAALRRHVEGRHPVYVKPHRPRHPWQRQSSYVGMFSRHGVEVVEVSRETRP